MSLPISPLECVLDAWVNVLADFRAWVRPETVHAAAWKDRPFHQAVAGCKSKLIDDAESMLEDWRKNENAPVDGGGTAFLPVMLTAVAATQQPPEVSQIVGVPYWLDVAINDGTEYKIVQLRTIPKAVRAQIVYFCTNPHDASSISDQFCSYMTDDRKRRFDVTYDLGNGIKDQFAMTVLENSLFPDVVITEAKNMTIVSVDVTMVGLVPQLALGTTDNGFNPENGNMGGTNGGQRALQLVVQADQFDEENSHHIRVKADPETGVITDEVINP